MRFRFIQAVIVFVGISTPLVSGVHAESASVTTNSTEEKSTAVLFGDGGPGTNTNTGPTSTTACPDTRAAFDAANRTIDAAISSAQKAYSEALAQLSQTPEGTCPDLKAIDAAMKVIAADLGRIAQILDSIKPCPNATEAEALLGLEQAAFIGFRLMELEGLLKRFLDLKRLIEFGTKCSAKTPKLFEEVNACLKSMQSGVCTKPGGCVAINNCRNTLASAEELLRAYKQLSQLPIPPGSGGGPLGDITSQMTNLNALVEMLKKALAGCLRRYQTHGGSGDEVLRVCLPPETPAELSSRKKAICDFFSDKAKRDALIEPLSRIARLFDKFDVAPTDGKISIEELKGYSKKNCSPPNSTYAVVCSGVQWVLENQEMVKKILAELQRGRPASELNLGDLLWIIARLRTLDSWCSPPTPSPASPVPPKKCCLCTWDANEDDKCKTAKDLLTCKATSSHCSFTGGECRSRGYFQCEEFKAGNKMGEAVSCDQFQSMPIQQFAATSSSWSKPESGFQGCTSFDAVHGDHYSNGHDDITLPSYLVCLKSSPNCTEINCIATGCARFEGPNGFSNATDRISTLIRAYGKENIKFTACGNQTTIGVNPFGYFGCTEAELVVDCQAGAINICGPKYPRCSDVIGRACYPDAANESPPKCISNTGAERELKCAPVRPIEDPLGWWADEYEWTYK